MLSRRHAAGSLISAIALSGISPKAFVAQAAAPSAAAAPITLSIPEQLLYATVRLTGGNGWGTGFLFKFFEVGETYVPAIITNYHVIEGMTSCQFSFHGATPDREPDVNKHILITISDFRNRWIKHPDADLVAILIGEEFNNLAASKMPVFVVSLDQSVIPTEQQLSDLGPLAQVLTVG